MTKRTKLLMATLALAAILGYPTLLAMTCGAMGRVSRIDTLGGIGIVHVRAGSVLEVALRDYETVDAQGAGVYRLGSVWDFGGQRMVAFLVTGTGVASLRIGHGSVPPTVLTVQID